MVRHSIQSRHYIRYVRKNATATCKPSCPQNFNNLKPKKLNRFCIYFIIQVLFHRFPVSCYATGLMAYFHQRQYPMHLSSSIFHGA